MNPPRSVVFDLGNVLLDFDYSKVAAKMLHFCDLPREELIRALNQSPLLHRYETGLLTTQQFFEEVVRVSRFSGTFQDFQPIFADIFSPVLEMVDLHRRLRSRSVPTYVFSNTNEIAIKHIRATYPFFGHFDGYILSYEHRAMKPEPAIYAVVERETRHRAAEILYIDDRHENVEQGTARGWRTIHH
jgi:FMN phosphatase YigB (HAD superfamily)